MAGGRTTQPVTVIVRLGEEHVGVEGQHRLVSVSSTTRMAINS